LENGGRQKDGHDFFTRFISANLGSLVSQGLLNGDQKIRYFGTIESPPSLIVSGPMESLDRLTEAWKNRLLKAPNQTKLLNYGLINNFGMSSVIQRQNIKLADLVLMAIADLNSMKLLASPSTIQQHLESKCEEMNIPNIKAIEYCVSELIKSKKIFFNNDGGYKLELKSIPQNCKSTPPTQNNNINFTPSEKISKIAETTSANQKPRPKTPTGKSKRKTFSFEFTKKLKNSLRRKTMSPTPAQNSEAKVKVQPPQQFNTPRDIPLVDSGIDQSGISIGEFNPSMTSTASQVTTPNWSDSAQSSNTPPDQYQTSTSPDQDYDSPLKLQKRQNQAYQQRACPTRYSDNESVASSLRGSGRVTKRKNSRRRTKVKSPDPSNQPSPDIRNTGDRSSGQPVRSPSARPSSTIQAMSNSITPTAPRRMSKTPTQLDKRFETPTSTPNHRSNIQLDLLEDEEDDHEDNEVGTIFSEERRFIRSDVFEFPPPPSYVQSKKIDSDDSIFGEDSEHVDSEHVTTSHDGKLNPLNGKNLNSDLTRTNSITFNIKKGGLSDSLTFEQINSPPVTRRDLAPAAHANGGHHHHRRSKTPVSIFEMKEQLQNHIEKQRNHRQRPMSCHPAFTTSPVTHHQLKGLSEDQLTPKTPKNDHHHNRYSGMWNKPSRSHSPVTPNIYRSPTLVKANFTPPTSPPPPKEQIQNTRPPPHSPIRSIPHPQLRSKTPAPRPAPRSSTQRERPKSVNPDRMLQMTGQSRKAMKKQLSLEVLEQLSLTREEWIEYFKTKKTPERLRTEIERLSPTFNQHEDGGSNTEDSGINSPKNRTSPMFKANLKPVHWTNV